MSSRDINRQESEMENQENDHVPEYEPPSVVDYGTLVDITRAGGLPNSDDIVGTPNTAFPSAS